MRTVLAVVVGVVVTMAIALILGEYPFTGLTPYLAAVAAPAVVATATIWTGEGNTARWWALTGLLSAAGIGWALWISTGRGVDPTPVGGWLAIGIALAWPLARAAWLVRRGRPGRAGRRSWGRPGRGGKSGPTVSAHTRAG